MDQMISILRSFLLPDEQKCPILEIPPEIFHMIRDHTNKLEISLVSQACLILSSKRFYQNFGYILKDPDLRFPYSDGLDSLKENHKRKQLLLLLETNNWWGRNWKYCLACIKLHPRNEFELEDYAEWPTGRPRKKQCK